MPFDPTDPTSDDDLLVQFAAGDTRAASMLTERLLPAVYRLAWRMLGDAAEAEDASQEAMLRLWRVAPSWRCGEAQVSTWLYQVTANLCTDRLRRRRTVPLDGIAEPEDGSDSVDERMQNKTRLNALHLALLDLPERQRQAVVLRHLEGLGNAQIADIMEIGPRAVESLTARGKKALARALQNRKHALGYIDDD